ncbi:MAG: hypothetical protein ACRC3B_12460 [Bacteroidia bacterium]
MLKQLFVFLVSFYCFQAHSQTDSASLGNSFSLREGVYLNFEQFRSNRPILLSQLQTNADRSAPDFMLRLTAVRTIAWKDSNGILHDTLVSKLWGYSFNRHVYIQTATDFTRLVVIGSLSHFTGIEITYMYAGGPGPTAGAPVKQQQQYVLDIRTGTVSVFTIQTMQKILEENDAFLYAEFMKLKKRKRNQQLFIYLRRYNERHPLKFPV